MKDICSLILPFNVVYSEYQYSFSCQVYLSRVVYAGWRMGYSGYNWSGTNIIGRVPIAYLVPGNGQRAAPDMGQKAVRRRPSITHFMHRYNTQYTIHYRCMRQLFHHKTHTQTRAQRVIKRRTCNRICRFMHKLRVSQYMHQSTQPPPAQWHVALLSFFGYHQFV